MTRIENATRLDQEQLDLLLRVGFVLDASGNNEHFSRRDIDVAIAEVDAERSIQDDEGLVRIFVVVPDEVALQLDDLELIVVHLGDDLRLPLLVEQPELLL